MSEKEPQELDAALGRRLRSLRQERGFSATYMAELLAEHGIRQSRVTVACTERGSRSMTVCELIAYARIFGVTADLLLENLPLPRTQEPRRHEAVAKAARSLGITPEEVECLSHRLWGHGLVAERNRRMGGASATRSEQASHGHMTRRLLGQILAEHERTRSWRPPAR